MFVKVLFYKNVFFFLIIMMIIMVMVIMMAMVIISLIRKVMTMTRKKTIPELCNRTDIKRKFSKEKQGGRLT